MTLTRERVLEMPAGPEMDALVAEHVLGWRWYVHTVDERSLHPGMRYLAEPDHAEKHPTFARLANGAEPLARYTDDLGQVSESWRMDLPPVSRDIAAAWEVLEALREKPWDTITVTYDAGEYGVALHEDAGRDVDYASCESAPLAICRAALLSVLGEK